MILDMVGGAYLNKNIRLLALNGRLVQIAFLEGSKAEIDALPIMTKRLTVTGSTLRRARTRTRAKSPARWPNACCR